VTAGREDDTAGALGAVGAAGAAGRLRASRADREQVIEVLKVAFVQERLAKDEFDLRVSQALASRTYADLHVLTADIPAGLTRARPSAEPTEPAREPREPARALAPKTVLRVSAAGAVPSMAFAAVEVAASGAPAGLGVILVGMTGVFVAGILAALLMFLSWAVRRAGERAEQGPPSGPDVQASLRHGPEWQLPPAGHDRWHTAESVRTRSPRRLVPAVSPGLGAPG
jgi:Domain of unknown function (DUF1707)